MSKEQYLDFMTRNKERTDCYTSVYCDRQINMNLVDTIFVEIDADTFDDATSRSKVLESHLRNNGIEYRKYFSGRRGFHYYLDMPPVHLSSPGATVAAFVRALPQVVDPHVLSGPRQMARTPFTRHSKTLLWCVPVTQGFTLQQSICPRASECDLVCNHDLGNILQGLDEKVEVQACTYKINNQIWPTCITNALVELQTTGELDHRQRLHLTAFLLKSGYEGQQVEDVYATYAKDYKPGITRQQIAHMIKTGMACYTCKNVQTMNLCPFDSRRQSSCDFYPSINHQVLYGNFE